MHEGGADDGAKDGGGGICGMARSVGGIGRDLRKEDQRSALVAAY